MEQIPNPQLDEISPIGDLKYPIGDIISNWVFSSVSLLMAKNNSTLKSFRKSSRSYWIKFMFNASYCMMALHVQAIFALLVKWIITVTAVQLVHV